MREMVIDQCLGTGREFTREALQTAVMVTENKSPRGERATAEAIANGFLTEADLQKRSEKPSNLTENEGEKQQKKTAKKTAKIEDPRVPVKDCGRCEARGVWNGVYTRLWVRQTHGLFLLTKM